MKKIFILFLLFLLLVMTIGCAKVKVGQKTVCKYCNKTLLDRTRDKTVAIWEKDDYHPKVIKDCCENCLLVITYGDQTICQECGKVLIDKTKTIKIEPDKADKYEIKINKGLCYECYRKMNDPVYIAKEFLKAISTRNFTLAESYCDVVIKDEAHINGTFNTNVSAREVLLPFAAEVGNGSTWIVSNGYKNVRGRKLVVIADEKRARYIDASGYIAKKTHNGKKIQALGYGFLFDTINGRLKIVETDSPWFILEK